MGTLFYELSSYCSFLFSLNNRLDNRLQVSNPLLACISLLQEEVAFWKDHFRLLLQQAELLVAQMNQLKLDHAKAMKEKEVEIHFLRCTATDSSLATVNALMAKKKG